MDNRRYILLWSGGFDSTSVLLHALQNTDIQNLVVCGCNLSNANCQLEDLNARKAIAETLKLESLPKVTYHEASASIDLPSCEVKTGQSQVWAYLASTLVSEKVGNVLCTGHIRYDDFWHFRPSFENAIINLIQLSNPNVDLSFYYPFEWKEKRELAHFYFEHADVFKQLSWAGDNGERKLKERSEIQNILQNYWDHVQASATIGTSTQEVLKEHSLKKTPEDDDYYI